MEVQHDQLHYSAYSHTIVDDVMANLMKNVNQSIKDNEIIRKRMNQFTSLGLFSLVTQINDQLKAPPIVSVPQNNEQIQNQSKPIDREDNEAINLQPDNMMRIQNIQPMQHRQQQKQLPQKIQIKNNARLKQSKVSSFAGNPKSNRSKSGSQIQKIANNTLNLKKLEVEHEQIDILHDQMRKQTAILKNSQKIKQQKVANFKRTSKQQVNYDYQGGFIPIKKDHRKNLIKNSVQSNFQSKQIKKQSNSRILNKNNSQQGVKRQIASIVPTKKVLDSKQDNNKIKPKSIHRIYENKDKNVQFSKITNLYQNLDVKEGVKAVFQKNVIENIEKKLSIKDLKQTLGNRKISKNQYQRLKTVQGKRIKKQQTIYKQKIQNNQKPIHDNLQKKRSNTQTISNEKLKCDRKYLQQLISDKPIESTQLTKPKTNKHQQKKQELNRIDKYNIQYCKNKNQQKISPQKQQKYLQFPKLVNVRGQVLQKKGSKSIIYPKNRQRIKDSATMMRQMKKKFQDNLRI